MRLFRRVIFLAATYLAITAARTVAQDPGTPGPDDFDAAPDHSVAWYLPRGASPRVRLEVRDANGNVLGVLAETLTT